ncbi:LON peptidase substrate-binding domain-containing protein [Shewanella maritima]|uniref:LON peptidase substrate-binding domain-containing protein n=1 Tax=Shewanella maritima TaxID=2520507 RepID=UPI003735CFF4
MTIPLFPLPICLLPQGYSQLRIFEPRYKRLVTETLKSGVGFGLCMIDNKQLLPIGTMCQIVDFDMLEDGLLGISIEGKSKFKLIDISKEEDGLKRGQVQLLDDWPTQQVDTTRESETVLSNTLKQLLEHYPKQQAFYQDKQFDDISWVCQRWLEVIPIEVQQKFQCINQENHKVALEVLSDIIKS